MLDERPQSELPIVFCLHYLGGSAREWGPVAGSLREARCVPLDLPGFGDASDVPGYAVADMAAYVMRVAFRRAPRRWFLAGHSMGAKVAAVLARAAEDGALELSGLAGLVLLAGSPPSPEPMSDEQRRTMLGFFGGDAASNRADATTYVEQNAGDLLSAALRAVAIEDGLRANRAAWRAWLERGSREDWSERVGIVRMPTLILAGADDENLGPSAQRRLTAPHFARVRSVTLPGAKHLLPLERPVDVARLIDEHVVAVDRPHDRNVALRVAYDGLIASDRVGRGTREALLSRAEPDDPSYEPVSLNASAFATLRAMLARIVPQSAAATIDVAARIDAQIASDAGDGWRFAILPSDVDAYRAGLLTVEEAAHRTYGDEFARLDPANQDDVLASIARGELGVAPADEPAPERLRADQMRAWFEDLRADAVKTYLGHPATLARIGYSGIANGGDGEPKSGFARIGLGEREAWEPLGSGERDR